MNALYLSPHILTPPHRVTRPEQVQVLADDFAARGWDTAQPALVAYVDEHGYAIQLLSGTHRHAAALRAQIRVPVVVWPEQAIRRAYGDLYEWDRIMRSGNHAR